MLHQTDDLRIEGLRPLIPPAILMEELPVSEAASTLVWRSRAELEQVVAGEDDRLLVVVGPCSVHDPEAALDYARRLAATAQDFRDDLAIVMRVYFEKPRTTVGWKGLINDPHLDGSFKINEGLRRARRFLLDVLSSSGCRPAPSSSIRSRPSSSPTWSPGARSGRAPPRARCTASWPRACRCRSDSRTAPTARVQVAIDAIRSSAHPHHFLSVTKQGVAAIVETRGNPECHVILRGGHERAQLLGGMTSRRSCSGLDGPRASPATSWSTAATRTAARIHARQPLVVPRTIAGQIADGSRRSSA